MKRYEKYKPSGIEWLGEIPEHWEVKRVKDITTKIGSGVTPNGGAEVYQDNGIPFIRSQNIQNNCLLLDDIAYISEEIDAKMSNSRICPNDVLLNITGASIGRCFYVPENFKNGNVNQHVCIIRRKKREIHTKNLHYEFISQFGQIYIDLSQNGANREGLNFQQIKNFLFLIPPKVEQLSIATYLDTKTAAIDRKIELLTAKADKYKALRRSLIIETVCRGLNSNATMKDSGIEWIGMIPEHWEVKRVKDAAQICNGKSQIEVDIDDDTKYPIYGSGGIMGYATDFLCKQPSLLLGRKGTLDKPLFVTTPFWTIDTMFYTKINNKSVSNKYFYYSSLLFPFQALSTNTALPSMTQQSLSLCAMVFPPISEQTAIANYLDEKTAQIDAILANIGNQIAKLTQLRKTLINDVVTGKIKVTEETI